MPAPSGPAVIPLTRQRTTNVVFTGTPDTVRPIGVKDLGVVGVDGVSTAFAKAVYHAAGRIGSLPITGEQLLEGGRTRWLCG
jgi:CO/xanthine dehydrogenase Mo-binding subunit